jgi:hypothetical protein
MWEELDDDTAVYPTTLHFAYTMAVLTTVFEMDPDQEHAGLRIDGLKKIVPSKISPPGLRYNVFSTLDDSIAQDLDTSARVPLNQAAVRFTRWMIESGELLLQRPSKGNPGVPCTRLLPAEMLHRIIALDPASLMDMKATVANTRVSPDAGGPRNWNDLVKSILCRNCSSGTNFIPRFSGCGVA